MKDMKLTHIDLIKRYLSLSILLLFLWWFSARDFTDPYLPPFILPPNFTKTGINDHTLVYHFCASEDCPAPAFDSLKFLVLIMEFREPSQLKTGYIRAMQLTTLSALKKLPKYWNFKVVGTKTNIEKLKKGFDIAELKPHLSRFSFDSYATLPVPADGTIQYHLEHLVNVLLLSEDFWQSLNADWAFTLQVDAFICQPGNPSFKFPYLGGPSVKFPITDDHQKDDPFFQHINGGFSIRNVKWTIEVVIKGRNRLPKKEFEECCEDRFFSKFFHQQNIPITWEQTAGFASDNDYTSCFIASNGSHICPYGLHKPKGRYIYTEQHCPGFAAWFKALKSKI